MELLPCERLPSGRSPLGERLSLSHAHDAQPQGLRHHRAAVARPCRGLHGPHGRDGRGQVHPDRCDRARARGARRLRPCANGRRARQHRRGVFAHRRGAQVAPGERFARGRRGERARAPDDRPERALARLDQRHLRHALAAQGARRHPRGHPGPACASAASEARLPDEASRRLCRGRRGARGREARACRLERPCEAP